MARYNLGQIIIGLLAERAAFQLTAQPGEMYLDEAPPHTLTVFDGAGGATTFIPAGGSLVLPLNEIAFGDGVSVSSSQHFTYDKIAGVLTLRDLAVNLTMLRADGGALREFTLLDELGASLEVVQTLAASRLVAWLDQGGLDVMRLDLKAASKGLVLGAAAQPQLRFDAVAGTLNAYTAGSVLVWSLDCATGVVSTPASTPLPLLAAQPDYAGAAFAFNRLGPVGANADISGLVAAPIDGAEKLIVNVGPLGTITVRHQSLLSLAANRIITLTGADTVLAVDGRMRVIYDATSARYREV